MADVASRSGELAAAVENRLEQARAELATALEELAEYRRWQAFDAASECVRSATGALFLAVGESPPELMGPDTLGKGHGACDAFAAIRPGDPFAEGLRGFASLHRLASVMGGCHGETYAEAREQVAELVDLAAYVLWVAEGAGQRRPLAKHGSVVVVRRGRTFRVSDGLALVGGGTRELDGVLVNLDEQRLLCFRASGTNCVRCGLAGTFFALEEVQRGAGTIWTLSLYGVSGGRVHYFTKDHRVPKVLGGPDELENFQTMCWPCNSRKGAKVEVETAQPG